VAPTTPQVEIFMSPPIVAPTPAVPVVAVPVPPPVPQPIPPGGAAVPGQAPSPAPRREKARKHASQSAYSVPHAGSDRVVWFYGATGGMTILTLLLLAAGLQASPRRRTEPAFVQNETRPELDRRRRLR